MASSLAAAFAEVEGPALDRIVYSGHHTEWGPPSDEFEKAFAGFDYDQLRRGARRLARTRRCDLADAEDAIQEELAVLMDRRPWLFQNEPERWVGLLLRRASFRLLDDRTARRPTSISALEESGGDAALADARLYEATSQCSDEDARYASLPLPGEPWTSRQVIAAFQQFRDYHGRPPRASDCRAINRLPSSSTIRRHFDSFDDAVQASGMVPPNLGRRRKRWSLVEAALACRSFQRRHGDWPNWSDLRRYPDLLPSSSVMIRCFGSTRPGEVRRVAEAVLRHADRETP